MTTAKTITLRFTIIDPIAGVAYSLQNGKNEPVGPVIAAEEPLSFDLPVRVEPGPRFLGDFVRREGPTRRFVYVAIGAQAGQRSSEWNRRAKIDVPVLPADFLERALAGAVVEARLPGRAKDGGRSCATLRPIGGWRIVE